jgi:hypothetical protein
MSALRVKDTPLPSRPERIIARLFEEQNDFSTGQKNG